MLRILTTILALSGAWSTILLAQDVNMGNVDVARCSGTFRDDGGTGNYSDSQQLEMLICSTDGSPIQADFTSFSVEAGFDGLWVWDGPDHITSWPAGAGVVVTDPNLPPGNSLFDGQPSTYPGTVRWISTDASFTPYFALTEHDRSRLSYVAEVDIPAAGELPVGIPLVASVPGGAGQD